MSKRTWKSFGLWSLIVLVLWVLAFIIAEAIPVFGDLLSLISALFSSWFTYGISGIFWLYLYWGEYGISKKRIFLTVLNVFCFLIGLIVVSYQSPPPTSLFRQLKTQTDFRESPDWSNWANDGRSAHSGCTAPGPPSPSRPRIRMGVFHAQTIREVGIDSFC